MSDERSRPHSRVASLRERVSGLGTADPGVTTALFGVIAVGVVLRTFRLSAESLWFDEGLSYHHVTTLGVRELFVVLPFQYPNPPLYFVLLQGWTALAGTSEAALRAPSVVFGVVAIALVYRVGRRLYSQRVGLLAAALLAVAPFQIRYAQEARMYALLIAAVLASYLFVIRYWEAGGRWNAVGYVVATTAMIYTHMYGLFCLLAQAGFVLGVAVRTGTLRGTLRRWSLPGVATGLLAVPWVGFVLMRTLGPSIGGPAGFGGGEAGLEVTMPLPELHSLASAYVRYWMSLQPFITGFDPNAFTLATLAGTLVALGAVALAVLGPFRSRRLLRSDGGTARARSGLGDGSDGGRSLRARPVDRRLLLVLWVVVPVVVPFALSYLVTPIFRHRYTIVASAVCYLLAGAGLARLRPRHLRYAAVAVVLVGLLASLPGYYATDQKEEWREAAAYVEGNAEPGDLVVVAPEEARIPYEYYAERDDLPVEAVEDDAPPGTIDRRTDGADVVWFVASHLDPATEARFVATLDERYALTEKKTFYNLVVRRYERR